MSICLRWRSEVPCVILRARGWNGKAKADAVVVASAIDARIIAGQKLSKVERDSEGWTASTQQSALAERISMQGHQLPSINMLPDNCLVNGGCVFLARCMTVQIDITVCLIPLESRLFCKI